jgi:hypothetical protein
LKARYGFDPDADSKLSLQDKLDRMERNQIESGFDIDAWRIIAVIVRVVALDRVGLDPPPPSAMARRSQGRIRRRQQELGDVGVQHRDRRRLRSKLGQDADAVRDDLRPSALSSSSFISGNFSAAGWNSSR